MRTELTRLNGQFSVDLIAELRLLAKNMCSHSLLINLNNVTLVRQGIRPS